MRPDRRSGLDRRITDRRQRVAQVLVERRRMTDRRAIVERRSLGQRRSWIDRRGSGMTFEELNPS